MSMQRKEFIQTTAMGALGLIVAPQTINNHMEKNLFIHHVYFWLKNPGNKLDRDKLVDGLTKLSKVTTIKNFHIGKPANTSRGVIDTSYDISWYNEFANEEDQASYQTDPIHLKFVEECSHLWQKVIVYDSVDV